MFLFKKKENKEELLKCPKCHKSLKKINKEGVVIDICESCKGMWLDDKEIDKLIKIAKGGKKNGKKK